MATAAVYPQADATLTTFYSVDFPFQTYIRAAIWHLGKLFAIQAGSAQGRPPI